ncbi:MAG: ATP-binding protein [Ignavibacteriales bacterium]
MLLREDHITEFKANWRDELLRYFSGFANTEGGKLFIGVDDDGRVIGITNADKLLHEIPQKSRNQLGIIPQITVEKEEDKEYLIIEIQKSYAPISYNGKYYTRSGSSLFELQGRELTEFLISRSGRNWEDYVVEEASMEEIDPDTIKWFRKKAKNRLPFVGEDDDKTVLMKLNLLSEGKLTRAAILLFGREPKRYFTSAIIRIGRFITDTEVVSTDEIEGNLFDQIEKAIKILEDKYLVLKMRDDGLYRKETWDYPLDALREALMNAIIHKDYLSSHIQLKVYPDKLTLWNSGALPNQLKIEDLKHTHPSIPRNPKLADTFFKAGLVETWGRGTLRIINECRNAGLPEPVFQEYQGGFFLTLQKEIITENYLAELGLSERQIKAVLHTKQSGKITNKEYQRLFGLSKPTASRELKELVTKEILEQVGSTGRGTYYRLKDRGGMGS